jgi:hypothetical protein
MVVNTLLDWQQVAESCLQNCGLVGPIIINCVGCFVGWELRLVPRLPHYRSVLMASIQLHRQPIVFHDWWYDVLDVPKGRSQPNGGMRFGYMEVDAYACACLNVPLTVRYVCETIL